MIISNNTILNNKMTLKIKNEMLTASARSMLGSSLNPLELYKLDSVSERIRGAVEQYVFHLVPKCSEDTFKYFEYVFSILQPPTEIIKLSFMASLAVHPKVAKAHAYDQEVIINTPTKIDVASGQFVLSLPKRFIKKLALLCPIADSQHYILDAFNSALFKALNRH